MDGFVWLKVIELFVGAAGAEQAGAAAVPVTIMSSKRISQLFVGVCSKYKVKFVPVFDISASFNDQLVLDKLPLVIICVFDPLSIL